MAKISFKDQVKKTFCTKKSNYTEIKSGYVEVAQYLAVGGKAHYFTWISCGASAKNAYKRYSDCLSELGFDFNLGNDAPKGGKNGDFLVLTEESEKKRKRYAKYFETEINKNRSFVFKNI